MNRIRKSSFQRILGHLLLIGFCLFSLLPFLWMISTSLKQGSQIYIHPPQWIPNPIRWSNYPDAIEHIAFMSLLKNTSLVSLLSSFGTMVTCPLAAYSLAMMRWAGRRAVFIMTVSVLMIPGQVAMVPEFVLFQRLGLTGTLLPLIAKPVLGVPLFIFLLRQFFLGVPSELQQAARLDGAGEIRIYWRIILPQAIPVVMTVGLFQFISSWNDFLGPLLYLNDPSMYTLALGLQQFQSETSTEWGQLMASALLMIAPIIVLFFGVQRFFFQGVTFTGLKS